MSWLSPECGGGAVDGSSLVRLGIPCPHLAVPGVRKSAVEAVPNPCNW